MWQIALPQGSIAVIVATEEFLRKYDAIVGLRGCTLSSSDKFQKVRSLSPGTSLGSVPPPKHHQ
jgi:hypothetical protein